MYTATTWTNGSGNPISAANLDKIENELVKAYRSTVTDLKALTSGDLSDDDRVFILGHTTVGDGGAGFFRWDASSTDTDDNGLTIQLSGGGTGRFKRIYSGEVNVRWFGATGDGTTEDTTACAAAVAATIPITGGVLTLYWPAGTYLNDANIALTVDGSDFHWKGDGIKRSIIKAKTATVTEMLSLPDSALGDTNFTNLSKIEGLTFDGNSVATYGIKGYANHFSIRDCRIINTTTAATDISYGWSNLYDNLEISSNDGDGIVCVGSGSNNDLTIRDCKIFSNTGTGILVGSGTSKVRIRGTALEQNAECAIFCTNAINGISITECYFESNSNTGYTFTTPAETIKADIILNGSGQATLGYGTPITNAVIENNYVASGGGIAFVYAGGMSYGSIKNNTLGSGVSRLLTAYGNNSGALTYGYWNNVKIEGNEGFGKTFTGTHTGANNASTLADSGAPFVADYLIGALVENVTDGSNGLITDNTTTDVTATLAGGTDDDWDTSDSYSIVIPEVGVINMPTSGTGSNLDLGGEFDETVFDGAQRIALVEPDFNQWVVIAGSGGTYQRSSSEFTENPNSLVWEINYGSSGTSVRQGWQLDMSKYPNLQGKFGVFEIWVKHPFSSDGNIQIFAGGTSDTPSTNGTNTWQKYKCLFRFPIAGTLSFGVQKVGAAGTVEFAAPHVTELGGQAVKIYDQFVMPYQFRGSAAPTAGTWKDGDMVWHDAPAVGSPAAWTCTTAGAPGTWTAWANL